MVDIEKIKRNIGKMIDQSAPESDIDAYLSTEGFTPDAFKAAVKGGSVAAPLVQPVPVDHDPFAGPTPVDHDPFAGNGVSYGRGIVNSVVQGLLQNSADEAYGGIGAVIDKLGGSRKSLPDLYAQNRGTFLGEGASFEKSNPYSSFAANVVGSVPLALIPIGAVSAAATVPKTMLAGSKAGAVFGGVSGFAAGEDGFANRAAGGLAGATIGSALGATIPAIGYGVGKVAQTGKRMLGLQNPEHEASGLLLRALQGDELTPEQLTTRIGTYKGKPVTVADMADENTRRLMDQVSLQGGVGSKRVNAFLDQRQADQGGRILGDIKGSLSPSTDTYGLDANLTKLRSASAPLWEEAMNQPPVWNDHLAKFADDPVVKQGMSQGIKLARLEALAKNEPFDPAAYAITGFNEAGDPILGGVPTWRTWQAAKEGLDQQIEAARGPFGQATKASRALTDAKNALLENLDSANPVYKQARAAWAGPSAQKDAIDVGDKFLRLDPEQIAAQTSKMSQDELAAFRVSAARALQDQVDKVKGLGDATKRIFNDNRIKDQIEAAFGKNAYLQFEDAMTAERNMAATRTFVTGNSRTAQRMLNAQDVGDQLAESFVTGGTKSAIARGISMATNRARGLNGHTGKALADLMTATDPKAQKAAMKRLVAYKKMQDALQSRLLAVGTAGNILTTEQASSSLAPRR